MGFEETPEAKPLGAIPSIEEILANPARANGLPAATLHTLLVRCAAAQVILAGALHLTRSGLSRLEAVPHAEKMITADEAAVLLHRNRRWIYRNAKRLPFVRHISEKAILISEPGLWKWLASRKA